jgi:hypothetical protein
MLKLVWSQKSLLDPIKCSELLFQVCFCSMVLGIEHRALCVQSLGSTT